MISYQYVILRYMPDLAAEEFINIGIVFWAPAEKCFKFKINSKHGRISECFQDFNGSIYKQFVQHLNEYFGSKASMFSDKGMFSQEFSIEEICTILLSSERSSFQWSSARFGICEDVDEKFRNLYIRYITQNTQRGRRIQRSNEDVWAKMQSELYHRDLQPYIRKNAVLQTNTLEQPFHMAWQNGVMQVAEPVSFDLTPDNIREKATNWLGKLTVLSQENDFKFTAVVALPTLPDAMNAYQDAIQILNLNKDVVRNIVPEEEFGAFLDEIHEEIVGHHE